MWFKTFMSESILRFKRPENQSQILKWKIWSKVESANSTMSGSQSFRGSFMIPVTTLIMQCDVCRKAGPDIACKTKFVTVNKVYRSALW
jgi:hypothetical protein